MKTKKVLNIVVNVLVYVIFALVLVLAISIIASGNKDYTEFFGTAAVGVRTDSMDGDKEDSFKKGALVWVKILSEEEKQDLKVGDVVTFKTLEIVHGKEVLNSHRITRLIKGDPNNPDKITAVWTKGDAYDEEDSTPVILGDILGVVTGHADFLGGAALWIASPTGFLVCAVIPSFLILAYCVLNLVLTVRIRNKEKAAEDEEALKERLLNELRAEGKVPEQSAEGAAEAPINEQQE